MKSAKWRRLFLRMSARTCGSSTSTRNRWLIFWFRLDTNMRVACGGGRRAWQQHSFGRQLGAMAQQQMAAAINLCMGLSAVCQHNSPQTAPPSTCAVSTALALPQLPRPPLPCRTWYTACGVQLSGSVRYRISSQFCRLGMTLKALGTCRRQTTRESTNTCGSVVPSASRRWVWCRQRRGAGSVGRGLASVVVTMSVKSTRLWFGSQQRIRKLLVISQAPCMEPGARAAAGQHRQANQAGQGARQAPAAWPGSPCRRCIC